MSEPQGISGRMAAVLLALLTACALGALRVPLRLPSAPMLLVPAMPDGSEVQLWLSTQDRKLRLVRQPDIPLAVADANAPPPAADITIDATRSFQTITGFGAAMTDSSAWLLDHAMDDDQRFALLQELFGPPPGLNLDMARVSIGASDFSLKPYTLDDMPAGQTDPGLAHFNLAASSQDVVPVLREAMEINPQLHVIATPWSAPAWMKSIDALNGGTLQQQYEAVYAQYLVKYVDAMQAQGVPVWALTVQNEPGFEPLTYPGMLLPAEARARIIGQYLGPALASRDPRPLILDWDHNWDAPEQPLAVLADATAQRYVDGVAWHCYAGSTGAQTRVHRAYPDKDAYLTECSGGDWASAKNGELLLFARDVLMMSLRDWARGAVYWNLALDQKHGPHSGGCADCKGMVTIDSATGAVHRNDEYYAFAHYSRFVLPGAVRVWSDDTGPDIHNVAFRNAGDGSIVLVVANGRNAPRHVGVVQGRLSFEYTMPPESVATFTWNPDQATHSWQRRVRSLIDKALRAATPAGAAAVHAGTP
ncbi:glycoside hydrolase family 30 beta sandwich domain-containing protein [Rhodanobacter sp. DHB23]|uniref:glycoside hydrolase family 30 protein n=1 Tax=Rhodanobacter sp. DHB23 TaxID=2775923 RepID=UPI00177F1A49|nr:glycoside hydrolase family 30 beta sandwich domain-containing protein [Rhodanobacter sp. DHB23]MBD8872765.1 glycosyl hydrolase [Rhodanobacter sp. DHB23]